MCTHPGVKTDSKRPPTLCGQFVCPYKQVYGCDFVTDAVQLMAGHMVDNHGFLRCDNFWCMHVFQDESVREEHVKTHHGTDVVIID